MPRKKTSTEGTGVKYRILSEVYYSGKTVKVGEVVTDLPDKSIPWLLNGGYIEKVS
jgi:hypothetical protein